MSGTGSASSQWWEWIPAEQPGFSHDLMDWAWNVLYAFLNLSHTGNQSRWSASGLEMHQSMIKNLHKQKCLMMRMISSLTQLNFQWPWWVPPGLSGAWVQSGHCTWRNSLSALCVSWLCLKGAGFDPSAMHSKQCSLRRKKFKKKKAQISS